MQDNASLPEFVDETTGQVLRGDLVGEARKLEMKYFYDKKVYDKTTVEEAYAHTGKGPISVRWIDISKVTMPTLITAVDWWQETSGKKEKIPSSHPLHHWSP